MILEIFINQGMPANITVKFVELFLVGKLTINQEVRNFVEGCLLGQFFDGVSAVAKNPICTINIGDIGQRGTCIYIPRIEGNVASFLEQLS